jgi:hypothetical protein
MDAQPLTAQHMEQLIRRYYDGCNQADAGKMTGCFTPDAVHYFPPGMTRGPFRGAEEIARRWCSVVEKLGAWWTIDNLLIDPAKGQAVIEWSNFTQGRNHVVRGTEWVLFDRDCGLIREIRAYLASPPARDLERLELEAFDYAGRGYPVSSPRQSG